MYQPGDTVQGAVRVDADRQSQSFPIIEGQSKNLNSFVWPGTGILQNHVSKIKSETYFKPILILQMMRIRL